MTEPELQMEPLEPELARLLAAEKARAAPPAALRERVLQRLGSSALDGAQLSTQTGSAFAWPRLPIAAALLVVGGLAGAGLHALMQTRADHEQTRERAMVVVAPAAPSPSSLPSSTDVQIPPAPMAGPAPPSAPDRKPPARSHPTPGPSLPGPAPAPAETDPRPREQAQQLEKDQALAAERALLEQARTALARGKPSDALALLSQHLQRFPAGRLAEERDALEILSLASNREAAAAQARAAVFRRQYPHSLMLRTIEAALSDAASSDADGGRR